jgi:MFS family permease
MSASPAHSPFDALRERNFRIYLAGGLCTSSGLTLMQAAIAWQVYQITGSALSLGLLGLVRFGPSLAASLVGGAVADRFDRQRIVIITQAGPLICSGTLLITTRSGAVGLPLIYALVLLIAFADAFESPARQALLPLLVSRQRFANAVTLDSSIEQFAAIGGPTVAGLIIAHGGVADAYAVHVVLLVGALVALVLLRPRQEARPRTPVSVVAIAEGVRFVWQRQILLGSMTLDMFAVIFAGATALLPIYAETILRVGASGYGLLASSQAVGALLMSIVLVFLPPVQRTGRTLLFSVAAFGLATIAFGFSRSFPLSLAAYALTGSADQVSMVMRHTTIQLATPDELRGRVSSVAALFINASNQVGVMESGVVAALSTATIAVVSGGAGCVLIAGWIAARMPELRGYRIDQDSGLRTQDSE